MSHSSSVHSSFDWENHQQLENSPSQSSASIPSALVPLNRILERHMRYGFTHDYVNNMANVYVESNFGAIQPGSIPIPLPLQLPLCHLFGYTTTSLPNDLHYFLMRIKCITPSTLINTFGGGV